MYMDHGESKGVPEKALIFCFIDNGQAFDYVGHSKLWKILREMRIPDHLTCLLRNLNTGQEEQLEPDMEQLTGSKLGKGSTTRQYIVTLLI